ncbi:MAG: hypothetical protein WAK41_16940, partial [Roseiarcus sp.]|uniref:hypothetical protein n=1 Tax=Roseiarcus sp. TaxID=1969460 RepID=UPI003BB03678
ISSAEQHIVQLAQAFPRAAPMELLPPRPSTNQAGPAILPIIPRPECGGHPSAGEGSGAPIAIVGSAYRQ